MPDRIPDHHCGQVSARESKAQLFEIGKRRIIGFVRCENVQKQMCNPVESEECKDVTKDVCKIR